MNNIKKFLIITLVINYNFINCAVEYFDTTFGKSKTGIVQALLGNNTQIQSISNYVNNQIIATGYATANNSQNLFITKYSSSGILDSSFGNSGISILTGAVGNSITYDANQNILVAGYATIKNKNFLLVARYLPTGNLDINFGTGGKIIHLIGSGCVGNAIAIDNLGRILIAGTTIVNDKNNVFVIRYNNNGTLDTTFGAGGASTFSLDNGLSGNSIAIDSSSKIIVGGSYQPNNVATNFMVMRILPSTGLLDQSFGRGGITFTSISQTSEIKSICIDSKQRIIAGGYSGSPTSFTIVRYNNNGLRDKTFASTLNGIQITKVGTSSKINSVVVDAQDRIIAGGIADNKFTLSKFLVNGSLDTTFGQSGILSNAIGSQSQINSVFVQTLDSKPVAAGSSNDSNQSKLVIARYNKNNSDFINVTSFQNKNSINTKVPTVSGSSSLPNAKVEIYVNGNYLTTTNTNSLGNWNAGPTNILTVGSNNLEARLISNSNTVVSQSFNFNVVDNLAEDSLYAYSIDTQTSSSSLYQSLPFSYISNNTWSYSNSNFTCNKSGTYLIEYYANAGLINITNNSSPSSIDVAACIYLNGREYLGSESQTSLVLQKGNIKLLTRSFIKSLNAGDILTFNFAVNIIGNTTDLIVGLINSLNPINVQPSYSLTISRIN